MRYDTSPTARALLALEAIQDSPGITAQRLGDHLGVTERAARRYVAILREADLPIESVTGPHGGYRVGRGLRLPPLMFTAAEALGLVMAVLEGHRGAADPTELVGAALSKILRVLPQQVAEPVRAVRRVAGPPPDPRLRVDPALTAKLVEACTSSHRVRIDYRLEDGRERPMEIDPWAVVLRHDRWYLLGWSQTSEAQRALRIDRVLSVFTTSQRFAPPEDLDALRTLEEHLSQGWRHEVDVLLRADLDEASRWIPRSLGRLEVVEGGIRLRATTDEPEWYARQLAVTPLTFEVVGSPALVQATEDLAARLVKSAGSSDTTGGRGAHR
ncbi:YafY family protein [Terrabacter sp. Root181]|uniref:helix-turn-helix transcriptional regulator n=1 Tax=Terrabacter sp. Root181 TaxID=1736484 RepID=UPI0006F93A1A|nr:WYL domain-containing protein [Terrabacter sp. Root181]KRB45559.1 DNA-binding protein [Terrabacter sp. Root181]